MCFLEIFSRAASIFSATLLKVCDDDINVNKNAFGEYRVTIPKYLVIRDSLLHNTQHTSLVCCCNTSEMRKNKRYHVGSTCKDGVAPFNLMNYITTYIHLFNSYTTIFYQGNTLTLRFPCENIRNPLIHHTNY